ncbi:hypothetical protein [Flavobacterium selenitireducens]|uniref:hypothetical protein n=1 Tax=Flavobacterium selenitireducens TaxID=2722704 RepID=UPI00168A9BBC|nr:hypothetical protein [Flavobacterium selenitireducens]MBD3582371.1 hypothetical protein [Flavobacterium selenitireducens]
MKTYFFTLATIALFGIPMASNAQTAITMTTKGSFDNKEMRHLLQFHNMDFYDVKIAGMLNGSNFTLVSKEIWNGKIRKTDTLFDSRQHEIFRIKSDTLKFTTIAGKTDERNLRVLFSFDRFSIVRNYKSTKSNAYSLRDFGTRLPIALGKPFYAFAYILPTEHVDGSSSWCEVEAAGDDIENWGKKFGIEHYLLFEMKFD